MAYFKAGAYPTSNCTIEGAECGKNNFAEVVIYNLTTTHDYSINYPRNTTLINNGNVVNNGSVVSNGTIMNNGTYPATSIAVHSSIAIARNISTTTVNQAQTFEWQHWLLSSTLTALWFIY